MSYIIMRNNELLDPNRIHDWDVWGDNLNKFIINIQAAQAK